MANLASLAVQINANAVQFHREMGKVTKGVDQVNARMSSLAKVAKGVGGVLAGAFALNQVKQFGQTTVREFMAAEKAMTRLGASVTNTGTNFARVRGQVESAMGALEDATTFGDDDLIAALQTVVRITNDYAGSMREMRTVADLAAGAQISLETAAQLVGKVMVGETGTLTRYGIVVKDGADAMQVLRDRFKGLAENEATSLAGRISQLNNEWGNFQEAIGGVITQGNGAADTIVLMRNAVRGLTNWIETHKDQIGAFKSDLSAIAGLAKEPIKIAVSIVGTVAPVIADFIRWEQGGFQAGAAEIRRKQGLGEGQFFKSMDQLRAERGLSVGAGDTWNPAGPASVFRGRPNLAGPPLAPDFTRTALAIAGVTGGGRGKPSAAPDYSALLQNMPKVGLGGSGFVGGFPGDEMARQASIAAQKYRDMAGPMLDLTNKVTSAAGRFDDLNASSNGLREKFASFASAAGNRLAEVASSHSRFVGNIIQNPTPQGVGMAALTEVFAGMMEGLAPAIESIVGPLQRMGAALAPLIASNPAIKLLAWQLNVLADGVSYVTQGFGWLLRAIGKAINWLLPGNPANGLVEAGQSMMDAAKATRNATEATQKFAESLSNVPNVRSIARLRHGIVTGSTGSTGTGTGSPGEHTGKPSHPPPTVNYNTFHVHSNASDPRAVAEEVGRYMERLVARGSTSRLSVALGV